ncbi:hypothetical protein A2837_00180 [Candidatus Kaiserbacteria bacterium RIFCSPHIGHO2_01_FULL_46_22]|uniref:histidine kinase n=1 Tax=Candidatus Kaiserbacteria bacterium RIFCSPHIGHO2_01_FULL_46_22 TaxID=1798475 RepID=A0A1F6BYL7_9BACT|nr:MAG: hypothetical protein A2837_00180 [Candidatus Kaiserbacteria bacterium RIFCSPHIGHO2_01_FULL_46_22]
MTVVIVELFELTQKTILAAVATSLQDLLTTGTVNEKALTNAVTFTDKTKTYVLGGIVALSVVFAMIAAYISLRPLREALTTQKRFISSLAHELRTPLAVLRVENEVAALDTSPDDPLQDTLKRNLEEIDRITGILNNLLLFNRVRSANAIVFEPIDFGEVVRTAIGRLEKLAQGRGVTVDYVGVDLLEVRGNRAALEQAVFNVLKNAIIYSNRGSVVNISFPAITDKSITLSIRDHGIGIVKKDLAHIFEPFYRSSQASEKREGTGIGLTLVFEIVKLHQGKLHVDSAPENGTNVEITLPRDAKVAAIERYKYDGVTYDFANRNTSS